MSKAQTNAMFNLAAFLYFPPMMIVFLLNVFTLMLADEGICVYGGELQQLGNDPNGDLVCHDIPTLIMVFPGVWFFLGQPPIWILLHWASAQNIGGYDHAADMEAYTNHYKNNSKYPRP